MRALGGAWAHVQTLSGVEASLEIEGRAGPGALDDGDAFLHAGPAVVAIRLEGLIVLQRTPAADAHVESASADHVEHGELLCQIDWVMQGQEAHTHPQAQRGGAGGHVGSQHGRRRAEAVVVEVMLGDPHRRVAEPLGGQHLLEARVVHRLLAPLLVPLHQEEQSEVHAAPLVEAGGHAHVARRSPETISPPIMVRRGARSAIAVSAHVKGSSSRAIRSARRPTSSEPWSRSRPMDRAFQVVKARTASSRVMRWPGCQHGSSPARGRRVTAAWRPWKGLASSTGKSEPPAMYAPASSTDRQA